MSKARAVPIDGGTGPRWVVSFGAEEPVPMHVISEKKLREFWAPHPEAETPLRAWAKVAREAEWEKFADIRQTYPHADQVGRFTVFNVGGNKFRLVVVVHFDRGKLYIRHVMTHREYDEGGWKGG